MTPIQVTCPKCGRSPGEGCWNGLVGAPSGKDNFHHERVEEAATMADEQPTNKWERALGDVYDRLCVLERQLGARMTVDDARILGTAINHCKYWKQPEFDRRFDGKKDEEDDS